MSYYDRPYRREVDPEYRELAYYRGCFAAFGYEIHSGVTDNMGNKFAYKTVPTQGGGHCYFSNKTELWEALKKIEEIRKWEKEFPLNIEALTDEAR